MLFNDHCTHPQTSLQSLETLKDHLCLYIWMSSSSHCPNPQQKKGFQGLKIPLQNGPLIPESSKICAILLQDLMKRGDCSTLFINPSHVLLKLKLAGSTSVTDWPSDFLHPSTFCLPPLQLLSVCRPNSHPSVGQYHLVKKPAWPLMV